MSERAEQASSPVPFAATTMTPAGRADPASLTAGRPSVLLVDDDSSLRRALRVGLERSGLHVVDAVNGSDAMVMLAATSFEWLVTDIVMPECEGIELLRHVRQRHPEMRIVAISGGGIGNAAEYLQVARLLGADHVLQKPFVYTELVDLLTGRRSGVRA